MGSLAPATLGHLQSILRGLSSRGSTHRSICDPSPQTLPLSPVRWGSSTLGGESRTAKQPGEAGGRAGSPPPVLPGQGTPPSSSKQHLLPSTECLFRREV